jgi:hypothetical protein
VGGRATPVHSNSNPAHVERVTHSPAQVDKFKEAARELKTGDDPQRYKERLRKLVRQKPGRPKSDG